MLQLVTFNFTCTDDRYDAAIIAVSVFAEFSLASFTNCLLSRLLVLIIEPLSSWNKKTKWLTWFNCFVQKYVSN